MSILWACSDCNSFGAIPRKMKSDLVDIKAGAAPGAVASETESCYCVLSSASP